MDGRIECVALRAVMADRYYRPGDTLHLEPEDAEALHAEGAIDLVLRGTGEALRPVTLVKGIGPVTAARLAAIDVETLEDLAQLHDGLDDAARAIDVLPAVLTRWSVEAQRLIADEHDGD